MGGVSAFLVVPTGCEPPVQPGPRVLDPTIRDCPPLCPDRDHGSVFGSREPAAQPLRVYAGGHDHRHGPAAIREHPHPLLAVDSNGDRAGGGHSLPGPDSRAPASADPRHSDDDHRFSISLPVFVLSDEVLRLLRARDSRSAVVQGARSGGSVVWRARVAGNMTGQLFLRSFERSDRIYNAMIARGYSGNQYTLNPHE
ncbi:MAG: hypothetical protein FJZ87_18130, partial [Chloroflexi bacterium]|nr:hypothetical protein [Chloroflexota bacterium]